MLEWRICPRCKGDDDECPTCRGVGEIPVVRNTLDLGVLQTRQAVWALRNFGGNSQSWRGALMGVTEEMGELVTSMSRLFGIAERVGFLNHALLKQSQGIRGDSAKHEQEAKDAIADIVIYLADLCTRLGWDFPQIVGEVWEQVSRRDWKKYPGNGVSF